jgi:hypothetical protein
LRVRPFRIRATHSPEAGSDADGAGMGYFFMTAIGTLTWLGYLPIPKHVLIWGCVGYILYDAVKR